MQRRIKSNKIMKIMLIFAAAVIVALIVGLFFVPVEMRKYYLMISGLLVLNLIFMCYFIGKNSRQR